MCLGEHWKKNHQCFCYHSITLQTTASVQVVERKTKENKKLGMVQCLELPSCQKSDRITVTDELHLWQRALQSLKPAPHLPSSEKSPTITLCSEGRQCQIWASSLLQVIVTLGWASWVQRCDTARTYKLSAGCLNWGSRLQETSQAETLHWILLVS